MRAECRWLSNLSEQRMLKGDERQVHCPHLISEERVMRKSMNNYTGYGSRSQATPQTEPIPGSKQVENSAGGYSFAVDDITPLNRFLILGSASNPYYTTPRKLTKENLDAVERPLKAGGGMEVGATLGEICDK